MTTTTTTWTINTLERNTADGVVLTAHYSIDAVSEDGVYHSGAYGSIGLEQPDLETMVPYSEITQELAVQWVQEKLGSEQVESISAALQNQIDEQRSPSKATGVPWAA